MFALAIWDRRARRLILARDRVGKKPPYYAATSDTFLFGSEIKALLTWPGLPSAPDLWAIDSYLTWGCLPASYTRSKEFANSQLLTTLSSERVSMASWSWSAPVIGNYPSRAPRGGTAR